MAGSLWRARTLQFCSLLVPFLSRGSVVRAISTATEQFHFGSTLGPGARTIRSNRAPGRRGKLVSSFFLFLVGASLSFLYFSLFREDTNNPGEQGATYSRTFICSEDSSSTDVPWLVTERCSVSALAFLQTTEGFVSSRVFFVSWLSNFNISIFHTGLFYEWKG